VGPLDSEDGSYFCDECDYKDVKTQSNTSFKCDMCEYYRIRQSDLKKHIKSTKNGRIGIEAMSYTPVTIVIISAK